MKIDHVKVSRRVVLGGTTAASAALVTACAGEPTTAASNSSTPEATVSAEANSEASVDGAVLEVPTLDELKAEVTALFTQDTYTDDSTGYELPFNIFVPEGADASTPLPLVLYIADASLVGQDVTAPLGQYGALVWASQLDQARHEAIVVVPEYPEVILDDHDGFVTTDYVELTKRFIDYVVATHPVDPTRLYGTGQSMGCMTVMYLAAKYPDLFTAELFVSGQWDISVLGNLAQEKFFYIAAGGDEKASAGQAEVERLVANAGVPYQSGMWDATWSPEAQDAAATEIISAGDSINFATFETGTVLTANPVASMEHMASFEPAYKVTAVRDWLLNQTP